MSNKPDVTSILTLSLAIFLFGFATYAGYASWTWWTPIVLAAIMAFNRANERTKGAQTGGVSDFFVRALVSIPFMSIFTFAGFGLGSVVAWARAAG